MRHELIKYYMNVTMERFILKEFKSFIFRYTIDIKGQLIQKLIDLFKTKIAKFLKFAR